MELREAVRRIFLVHWFVVLACLVGGVAAAALIDRDEVTTYAASSRLVLDVDTPRDRAASTAIADTARAIVTSPTHVAAAIAQVGVQRDPVVLGRRRVKLEALGASIVLQLSVRDQDPMVAARLANALATDLIKSWLDISRSQMNQATADLDTRIDAINRQISQVDADSRQTSQIEELNSLTARRSSLDQEKAALIAARQRLIETAALRPKAAIVDLATPPSRPVSTRLPEDIALGALLGLVLGAGLASLFETFRPTLVGREALSRALRAPILGELRSPPGSRNSIDTKALSTRLSLAASATQVKVIELIATKSIDLTPLAESLRGQMSALLALAGAGPDGVPEVPPVVTFASSIPPRVPSPTAGFVVVTPDRIKQIDLNPTSDLLSVAGRPLLGIITYKRRWWRRPRRRPQATASVGATSERPTFTPGEGQSSTAATPLMPPPVVQMPDSSHTSEDIREA